MQLLAVQMLQNIEEAQDIEGSRRGSLQIRKRLTELNSLNAEPPRQLDLFLGTVDSGDVLISAFPKNMDYGPVAAADIEDAQVFIARKKATDQIPQIRRPPTQLSLQAFPFGHMAARDVGLVDGLLPVHCCHRTRDSRVVEKSAAAVGPGPAS